MESSILTDDDIKSLSISSRRTIKILNITNHFRSSDGGEFIEDNLDSQSDLSDNLDDESSHILERGYRADEEVYDVKVDANR